MASLVIVESPAKAKTIARILGKGYVVEASYGHVRDLPDSADEIPARFKKESWSRLGVNVDADFQPLYIIPSDKKKYVKRLKDALAGADELLLATDEDREGESISWHVVEVLKPTVPVRRIAFHEITASAVREALEHPREVDLRLVRAQEARRILDRLYGYTLSPVLWKKVRRGLSAGRVQSVAVRLCVIRERERRRFRKAGYWDAEATFEKDGSRFTGRLSRVDDQKVAGGQDFEQTTGELKGKDVLWLPDRPAVTALVDAMGRPFRVAKIEEKPITQRPAPPFTTSSLQQEANRKLGFAARHTMRIAQKLYEGVDFDGDRVGLITYMRTDSVILSEKALGDAEAVIKKMYGDAYTEGPRRYKTKSANAQEAHEAIRPTEVARTPESLSNVLDRDGLRLYELIWKRTLASQMADAKVLRTAVEIESLLTDGPHGARTATFNASGKQISFPGYLRAYVEGSDDPDAEMADKEVILPALAQDESIDPTAIEARGHETQPPARYTEASLVKKLEAEGIGRPSTYASIIDTIQYRNYVVKQGNALIPTFTAFCVTQLLEDHFADYVDLKFTARMEQSLDDISNGELDWREHLAAFYNGNGTANSGLVQRVQNAEPNIDYPAVEIGRHPETGEVVLAKVGRYGPYVQLGTSNGSASADEAADGSDTSAPSSKTSSKKSSKKSAKKSAKKGGKKTSATSATSDDRIIASLPNDVAPADLTVEEALDLIRRKQEGPRCVGQHPDSGLPIYILTGRFGPYLQEGETPEGKKAAKPKRASIPKGMSEDAVTLEQAVLLLSLPRTLGTHPETGEEVIAAKGRFGAYLKCGSESRSLRGQHDADVYTISLEEALPILKEPKKGAARRRQRTVLSDLGKDKSGRAVEILDGPYGPYVTNGEVNASLPDGVSPEEMTLDRAVRHLAENGKAPKRGRSRAKK